MRLLHAADLHLDSPFRGLSAEKARERRLESRDLLDRLANLANARCVDAVLLAGDLFDGERVYPETLEAMARSLGSIRCPVFIAPGNHDPYHSRSPYCQVEWPGNVHLFTSGHMERVELPSAQVVPGDIVLLEAGRVDAGELARTAFILGMDTKTLCSEDCKGLCPRCGADLNLGPCSCKKETDPRLAVLAKLLENK